MEITSVVGGVPIIKKAKKNKYKIYYHGCRQINGSSVMDNGINQNNQVSPRQDIYDYFLVQ